MRISDWSSDVCSSDLSLAPLSLSMFGMAILAGRRAGTRRPSSIIRLGFTFLTTGLLLLVPIVPRAESGWYLVKIGRATCRESVCPYVLISVGAVPLKKQDNERIDRYRVVTTLE